MQRSFLKHHLLLLLLIATSGFAQSQRPNEINQRAAILRGEYGRYRANNDLLFYHLDIRVDPEKKSLSGKNTIRFRMLSDDTRIQLDLQNPLFNQHTGRNLTPVFNQYLRRTILPVLELKFDEAKHEVSYRWKADEPGFAMPVKVGTKDHWQTIQPGLESKTLKTPLTKEQFAVATDLYFVDVGT